MLKHEYFSANIPGNDKKRFLANSTYIWTLFHDVFNSGEGKQRQAFVFLPGKFVNTIFFCHPSPGKHKLSDSTCMRSVFAYSSMIPQL